jgi:hypothetical protein
VWKKCYSQLNQVSLIVGFIFLFWAGANNPYAILIFYVMMTE